jgi:UDP-3-O-acyl N-acetylglucosamine deacetylase
MYVRNQHSIGRPAEVSGVALFSSVPSTVRFLPARSNTGVRFRRSDQAGAPEIPALVDWVVPCDRRTVLEKDGCRIELTEHVLAAVAGLQIDNLVIEVSAPECPGCDGSSLEFAETLAEARIVDQGVPIRPLVISHPLRITSPDGRQIIDVAPSTEATCSMGYSLDYGSNSPIPAQYCGVTMCPETFLRDLAFARTFALEAEARALRAAGMATHLTEADIVVFGQNGVIGNRLRAVNECARHKLLDCVGDLSLVGFPIFGAIEASRSGHRLNAEAARVLRRTFARIGGDQLSRAA